MATVLDLFSLLVTQQGDSYKFGHEVRLSDEDPDTFDCSELVQWACHRLGITPKMPDRSWIQWQHCQANDSLIPVVRAIRTPGALLFRFQSSPTSSKRPRDAHVVISLGNGMTFEASREIDGVGIYTAEGRVWTHAGLIPGLVYDPQFTYSPRLEEVVS